MNISIRIQQIHLLRGAWCQERWHVTVGSSAVQRGACADDRDLPKGSQFAIPMSSTGKKRC